MNIGKIIVVEGPIAVGKSTTIKAMSSYLRDKGCMVYVFNEDVDDTPLRHLFGKFCEDEEAYASPLQYSFLSSSYTKLQFAKYLKGLGYICIMERSHFGVGVFTDVNHEMGRIDDDDYDILTTMIKNSNYIEDVDEFLFLTASVEMCVDRTLERLYKRPEEISYSKRYYLRLHKKYWNNYILIRDKTTVLDVNNMFEEVYLEVMKIIDKLCSDYYR